MLVINITPYLIIYLGSSPDRPVPPHPTLPLRCYTEACQSLRPCQTGEIMSALLTELISNKYERRGKKRVCNEKSEATCPKDLQIRYMMQDNGSFMTDEKEDED